MGYHLCICILVLHCASSDEWTAYHKNMVLQIQLYFALAYFDGIAEYPNFLSVLQPLNYHLPSFHRLLLDGD
jgi:hypothetical protein